MSMTFSVLEGSHYLPARGQSQMWRMVIHSYPTLMGGHHKILSGHGVVIKYIINYICSRGINLRKFSFVQNFSLTCIILFPS